MRRFLNRFPDGSGGPIRPMHFSAGFAGGQGLTNANSGGNLTPPGGQNPFISFWVMFDALPAGQYQKIVNMGQGLIANDVFGVQINGTSGQLEAYSSNGSAYSVVGAQAFTPQTGVWYWVMANFGGFANQIEVYIGGTVPTPGGSAGSLGMQAGVQEPLFLGRGGSSNTFPLTGKIDSFGYWRAGVPAAISSGDFAVLRNGGKALEFGGLPTTTGLTAWYDFNEATNSPVYRDASGGGSNLSPSGIVTRQKGAGF